MRATRIEFDRSPLATGVPRRGCLKRREGEVSREVFSLTPPEATLSSLQLVEARPYWAMENTNHITRLSARRGAPPTEAAYDAQVVYPIAPPRGVDVRRRAGDGRLDDRRRALARPLRLRGVL